VIYDASLDELLQKTWAGQRINPAEALRLYHLPLEELGALADRRRQLAKAKAYAGRGNEIVTYIVDRNVNYTNVCISGCLFCAFYKTPESPEGYILSFEELDCKIRETLALGGTLADLGKPILALTLMGVLLFAVSTLIFSRSNIMKK